MREKITDWLIFDSLNEFDVFDAACLWMEIMPNPSLKRNPPLDIWAIVEIIHQTTSIYANINRDGTPRRLPLTSSGGIITRQQLENWVLQSPDVQHDIKNSIIPNPKFLLPEIRQLEDNDPRREINQLKTY